MPRLSILAAFAVLAAAPAMAGEGARAGIVLEEEDGEIIIVGSATALEEGSYTARMAVEKTGTSGRASTSQGSRFELEAGETADIARLVLSVRSGDRLSVTVEVLTDGRMVDRASAEREY